MKKWKYAIDLLLGLCMALVALVAIPQLLGFRLYAVASQSMAPAIVAGSAAYVRQAAFAGIRPGDIVTYRMGEDQTNVTHRVVEKRDSDQTFVTKGDANEQADGKRVSYADVIGTVRASVPYLGYFAAWVGGFSNRLFFFGIILWLLLLRSLVPEKQPLRIKRAELLLVPPNERRRNGEYHES